MRLIESDVQTNGIKLHVYRSGEQKPAIVFSHGVTDNGLCFLPIAVRFADMFEIILVDARGHGQSDVPEPASTLERARDIAGLVIALGLEDPILIGHSMGAVSVGLCAGLYPDMPGKIILEDPPTFERMAGMTAANDPGRAEWIKKAAENRLKSIDVLVEMNRQENPNWPESERTPWALAKKQFNMNVFEDISIEPSIGNKIFNQIACPALIITADPARGGMFPSEQAEAFSKAKANFHHVHIAGAGHSIRRDQPESYFKAIKEFVSKA